MPAKVHTCERYPNGELGPVDVQRKVHDHAVRFSLRLMENDVVRLDDQDEKQRVPADPLEASKNFEGSGRLAENFRCLPARWRS